MPSHSASCLLNRPVAIMPPRKVQSLAYMPSKVCLPQVDAVEFGDLSIEQQIRLMRQTDVLAGYHGAALTLSLFMPPESALVEVEEDYR